MSLNLVDFCLIKYLVFDLLNEQGRYNSLLSKEFF